MAKLPNFITMIDDRAIDMVRAVCGALVTDNINIVSTTQEFLQLSLDRSYLLPVMAILEHEIRKYMHIWEKHQNIYETWRQILSSIEQKLPPSFTQQELLCLQDLVTKANIDDNTKQSLLNKIQRMKSTYTSL